MAEVSSASESPPTPDKIVQYPITGDETGGRLFLFGSPDAENIVLFCAGYPDDHTPFLDMAARMATEGKCFCGVACLVGFDMDRPWASYRPQGYNLSEMTTSLRSAAKALREESSFSEAKLTTIFHDWGSVIGSMYTNEALEEKDALTAPAKIVYFDVMPMTVHPSCSKVELAKKTAKESFTEIAYRVVFATCFLIQRYISQYIAAFVFIFCFVILGALGLSPSHPKDDAIIMGKKIPLGRFIYMAFPYYYMFLELAKKGHGKFAESHLPLLGEIPVMYLYGEDKKVQYHDKNVEKHLAVQKNCEVVAVQDAAHYLYLQKPDICFDAVSRFILSS